MLSSILVWLLTVTCARATEELDSILIVVWVFVHLPNIIMLCLLYQFEALACESLVKLLRINQSMYF